MEKPLKMYACLLDSDVIINWLTKEEDPNTDEALWKAPHKILKSIETGEIKGATTLVNLLEISVSEERIKSDLAKIVNLLDVLVPDEVNLLKANALQDSVAGLGPFDAIILATSLAVDSICLISRDKNFLSIASKFLNIAIPEEFLKKLKSE